MNSTLQAIIFDVDGTIIANTPYHEAAFIELGRRYQVDITTEKYTNLYHAKTNKEILTGIFGDISDQEIHTLAEEKESIYRELYHEHIEPMAGLNNLVDQLLANGIYCVAASNGPRVNVDFAINKLELKDKFKFSLSFDDVTNGKPAPDLFLLAGSKLSVAPENCLVFEDSPVGFMAAQAANMKFIAIAEKPIPQALTSTKNYEDLSFERLNELFKKQI